MKRRSIIFFLLTLIFTTVAPLYATTEFWIGTAFINKDEQIDKSIQPFFDTLKEGHDDVEINNVTWLGPSLDFAFFPYTKIPIGIRLTDQILFPVSINKTYNYQSYNHDFKNRVMIGLNYAQAYTEKFGMSADFGFMYDYNRISKTNDKNQKNQNEYFKFDDYGLYGELCLLTKMTDGYFKFGFNYSKSLNNSSYSIDVVFSGGFVF